MKVIVLGGDGFCGWPCAVNLAEQNHEVIIVDNLSRRKIDIDLSKQYQKLLNLLIEEKPDSIVHFAEQRAAPYSMKSSYTKRYTVDNNVNGTHNLLAAIVESNLDIHIVHLGTMGVYGLSLIHI